MPCILKYMACIFYKMPYVFSDIPHAASHNPKNYKSKRISVQTKYAQQLQATKDNYATFTRLNRYLENSEKKKLFLINIRHGFASNTFS